MLVNYYSLVIFSGESILYLFGSKEFHLKACNYIIKGAIPLNAIFLPLDMALMAISLFLLSLLKTSLNFIQI